MTTPTGLPDKCSICGHPSVWHADHCPQGHGIRDDLEHDAVTSYPPVLTRPRLPFWVWLLAAFVLGLQARRVVDYVIDRLFSLV